MLTRDEFKRRIVARLRATEKFAQTKDDECWDKFLTGLKKHTAGAQRIALVVLQDWLFESDFSLD